MPTTQRMNAGQSRQREFEFALTFSRDLQESARQHDDHCQRRVNLFLSLITISGSAIVIAATGSGQLTGVPLPVMVALASTILLVFGVATLHRLNVRSVEMRKAAQFTTELEEYWATISPKIHRIIQLSRELRTHSDSADWYRRTLQGSYAEFMYLANSMLIVAIVLSMLWASDWRKGLFCDVCLVLVPFIISILLQHGYSKWMRNVVTSKDLESLEHKVTRIVGRSVRDETERPA